MYKRIKDIKIANQLSNHNYIVAAAKARKWIKRNTIQGNGIVITSKQRIIYQEVTGYYIPTLLQWGMRDEAIAYAKYLCDIQESSGAWLNGSQTGESVFNTGQVLRGLVAIVDIYPRAEAHLLKGCNWLLSNMNEDGCLVSTKGTEWSDDGINSELIHLYCLPPLEEVGKKYNIPDYTKAVKKIVKYYLENYKNDVENFNYLSHFYAYVLEALLDLGETEIVRKAMLKIQKMQKVDGSIPAFKNCNWVCSTGLFQLAIIWFKLGEWKYGNKAFDYAVSLQNESGGWYGGYPAKVRLIFGKTIEFARSEQVTYFPSEEISWAVKYFFDALYYREKLEFEQKAHTFIDCIDSEDGKYKVVNDEIEHLEKKLSNRLEIADIGCGKGRYLKKLIINRPEHEYYGIDLSNTVLSYIQNRNINLKVGSILNTGCSDSTFDLVFAAESLEHAIFIDLALKELVRITKPGGSIVIIDKEQSSFEKVKYYSWIDPKELSTKQWLDMEQMITIFEMLDLEEIDTFFIPSIEGNMYKAYIGRKKR